MPCSKWLFESNQLWMAISESLFPIEIHSKQCYHSKNKFNSHTYTQTHTNTFDFLPKINYYCQSKLNFSALMCKFNLSVSDKNPF